VNWPGRLGDAIDSEHRGSEKATMSHDILSDVLRTVRLRGALFFM
jgi:hypothetical protein